MRGRFLLLSLGLISLTAACSDDGSKALAAEDQSPSGETICSNPTPIEKRGLPPITKASELPNGIFKLTEIQEHSTGDSRGSYSFSARESDGFVVHLDCNGLKKPTKPGTYTTKKITSNTSENLVINVDGSVNSANFTRYDRLLNVEFYNGNLTLANSQKVLSQNQYSSIDTVSESDLVKNRVLVKNENNSNPYYYVTSRVYAVSPNKLEHYNMAEFGETVSFSKTTYVRM